MSERAELVAVTDARARLNELLSTILPERDVVLLRHSRPAAIMISPDRYEALLDRIEELEGEMTALAVRAGLEETEPWENIKARLEPAAHAVGASASRAS
jgi:PHD/YefM family antitoxin component YafN of YafNO toxin-antitoxin module